MRYVSYECRRANQHAHFYVTCLFSENRAAFEITWKNVVDPGRPTDDSIILGMRSACRLPKAADTHSEYVILRFYGNWLRERTSILLLYVHCLSCWNRCNELRRAVKSTALGDLCAHYGICIPELGKCFES
jgi:hypothetical protein